MSWQDFGVRKSIIPDNDVKLLDLCLAEGENGILPELDILTKRLKYGEDSTYKEIISKKFEQKEKILPITLRKRLLYDKTAEAVMELEKQVIYEEISRLNKFL